MFKTKLYDMRKLQERIPIILEAIRKNFGIWQKKLSEITGINDLSLRKYLAYLENKGIIVKKKSGCKYRYYDVNFQYVISAGIN